MTQHLYTQQRLEGKTLQELKAIASQLGAAAQDKRLKQSWIEAILAKQPQPVVAPKPLVEMDGDTCLVEGKAIATITNDEELTQPWVVKIEGVEVHRNATWARCYDYVRWHYKQGTLPSPQPEQVDDYLFHEDLPADNQPKVGDSHFIGNYLLRCIQVGGDYVAAWNVLDDGIPMGEIKMTWQCFWEHNQSFTTFATPQEAVADLHESALLVCQKPLVSMSIMKFCASAALGIALVAQCMMPIHAKEICNRGDGRRDVECTAVAEYTPQNNGGPDCGPCLGSGTRFKKQLMKQLS
ncbi:hypothetical protein [Nostoc punctiforme]|uniref:Uncharacterized protein n=2 Tax=Nostoc punctiforme TaxID=272131 RepID=B2ITF7_NOSP7|nr:hypothetical protein [Nostoc punctiforme]ACC81188.1 hypothetical protein Npun_R2634 [Nostoc punctiforme PCC 73102]RCJ41051.1 hypothetical protein A6769_39000 [Nostoc punctiforme NIES-2108]